MQSFTQQQPDNSALAQLAGLGSAPGAQVAPEQWYLKLGWDRRAIAAEAAAEGANQLSARAQYAGKQVDNMLAAAGQLKVRSGDSSTLREVLVAAERFEAVRADAEALGARVASDAAWLAMAVNVPTGVRDVMLKAQQGKCYRCDVLPESAPGVWNSFNGNAYLWFLRRTGDEAEIEFAYSWVALCLKCFGAVNHSGKMGPEGYALRPGATGHQAPMVDAADANWFQIDINGRRSLVGGRGSYDHAGKWQPERRERY